MLAEVNLSRHNEDDVRRFEEAVAACPQIVSCYATTGQADYVIKVLVPEIKSYETFLHETIFKLLGRDARALERGAEGGEGGDAAAAGKPGGSQAASAAQGRLKLARLTPSGGFACRYRSARIDANSGINALSPARPAAASRVARTAVGDRSLRLHVAGHLVHSSQDPCRRWQW